MSSTNNSNITDSAASETLEFSTPIKKRRRLTKTVPESSPILDKLIDFSINYSYKVKKELTKNNVDSPRLEKYVKIGLNAINILQGAISNVQRCADADQLK